MQISAGLLIIYQNKILLAKPIHGGKSTWGIPKGKTEKGETLLETAIRETKEEVGITITADMINQQAYTINYKNKKTLKFYKQVVYYICEIQDLSQINLSEERIPTENLQTKEISKARFFTLEEAKDRIFWRQKEVLNFIKPTEMV